MATSVDLPSTLYQAGTISAQIDNLPAQANGVRATFTRENWPVGRVARFKIEISHNDGVTWHGWMGPCTLAGGDVIGRNGQIDPLSWKQATWPGENAGTGPRSRRSKRGTDARLTFTVTQPIQTAIKVELI